MSANIDSVTSFAFVNRWAFGPVGGTARGLCERRPRANLSGLSRPYDNRTCPRVGHGETFKGFRHAV